MKLKRRSLHPCSESGELHLPIRIGSSLKIELPHASKAIRDMNLDGGRVNGFAVRPPDCKFEGTGTCTTLE
jgi:hypothetical protein